MVAAGADEAEQARRLPAATVDALVAADLMRMGLAAAYDGPEADPADDADGDRDPVERRRRRRVVLDDRVDDVDAVVVLATIRRP